MKKIIYGISGKLGVSNSEIFKSKASEMNIIIEGTKFKDMSISDSQCIALDMEGNIWFWGQKVPYKGNINVPTYIASTTIPTIIKEKTNFEQILLYHSIGIFAIDNEGVLWGMGYETALGGNAYQSSQEFIKIKEEIKFSKIATGGNILALDIGGNVWIWGDNINGKSLGNGFKSNLPGPTMIMQDKKFKDIMVGDHTNYLIDADGALWVFGHGVNGVLGNGESDCIIDEPIKINENVKYKKLAFGAYRHVLALDENGNLWGWGVGSHGQLGTEAGEAETRPIRIF